MKNPESSAICQGTIMEDGLLSLKWNNHKITFCEILRTLREKSHYTDATIAVEGKFYPVHKLVLSTCSEYFEDIFARTPCKSPVIVLKDVRSQDMDALLDYMYLGEVNVNQNDLASLLKTAECLRIRGLAVPDEENTKSRKAPSDERHDSPPPKRRRHDETSRPVSPPPSASTKTPTPLPSPVQPTSAICSQPSPDHLDSDPPPHIVKVEMQEHDHEDGFRQDSYEGSVNEEGGGDFGADVSKAEHDPESYGSSSFPGPSLQPGGDLAWEEGDSSSFPPETFSSDVPAGQQPQGEDAADMAAAAAMQQHQEQHHRQRHVANIKSWISGALGRLQMTHLSPPALLKLNPLLGAAVANPALSVAWVEGSPPAGDGVGSSGGTLLRSSSGAVPSSVSTTPRPSSTPGPSSSPSTMKAATASSGGGLLESKFKQHKCSKCGDTFPLPVMLAMHSLNHVDKRPFVCPYPSCHYNSVMRGNVKRHIRIAHGQHTFMDHR
ncbi:protein tramtrack, beta isoform-like isoform X3 [Macrobrachium nipponense]|uniref:protein tramtrack, beta isoform-like isoform X3 n=1 Tax=Macrobrachium nipponense TaxID=159736 RepID=UPI0030C8A1B9